MPSENFYKSVDIFLVKEYNLFTKNRNLESRTPLGCDFLYVNCSQP